MSRRTVLVIAIASLLVILLAAAIFLWLSRSHDRVSPAIEIRPDSGGPGSLITVAGSGWRAGRQVEILVGVPYSTLDDDSVCASARVDARGGFTAYFTFPEDGRWSGLAQVWVVARVAGEKDQVTAWFRLSHPTFTPQPIGTPTPVEAQAVALVQGVDEATNSVSVLSPDYFGDKVILNEDTVLVWADGSRATLSDLAVGDRIRIVGYLTADGTLVADQITITEREAPSVTDTPVPATPATPTIEPTVTPSATLPPTAPWRGEYYPNPFLSGEPVLVRGDQLIDFRWGTDGPTAACPADHFSVRWTGLWYFVEGVQQFRVRVDDGVRLYLDGAVVLDEWHDGSPVEYEVGMFVSEGQHEVMVEYYEATANAEISLSWSFLGRYPDWKGEYFSNAWLEGTPALVRNDPEIGFVWGAGSPAATIAADRFSVRWTRTLTLDAADYRFLVQCDDGVRVWVDDRLIVDAWDEGPKTGLEGEISLASGDHRVKVEYYEGQGAAQITVGWERITQYAGWRGAYYGNPTLAGQPHFVRDDEAIAFEWNGGSPGSGLPADSFSVRWTRRVDFAEGNHVFHVTADDGVRLWIDDDLILDHWVDGYLENLEVARFVTEGTHVVKVEYYQRGGNAIAHLWWEYAPDGSTS